jgi:hypothetical protein
MYFLSLFFNEVSGGREGEREEVREADVRGRKEGEL